MPFDLGNKAENILDSIIALIVVLAILGATIGGLFGDDLTAILLAFTSLNTGVAVLDALGPVLAIVVGFMIVFGVVKVVRKAITGATGTA